MSLLPPDLLILRILQLTLHDHLLPKDFLLKNSSDSEIISNNFSNIQPLLVKDQMTFLKILHGCFVEPKSTRLVHSSELSPQAFLWTTSLNFSMSHLPPLPLFRPQFYWQHLTSLLSQSICSSIPTYKPYGSFVNHSILTKLLIQLLTSCNFSLLLTRFLIHCGKSLFKINFSTSKNCMLQWIRALVIMTI